MKNRQILFWSLTAAIFIILVAPGLFMDGMFMDGTQYACVSKNLANGKGTFWSPFLSDTWIKNGSTAFQEQPPLMYLLQSWFFLLLGNGVYVERIYILVMALLTGLLIHLIWRLLAEEQDRKYSWLPLLLWIIIPLVNWAYRQNLQENTMGLFTTAAVYFSLLAACKGRFKPLYAIISGIFIFLATFTKGVPGLFPLVTIAVFWLYTRQTNLLKSFLLTLLVMVVPVIIYSLLLQNGEARENLSFYLHSRLLNRIDQYPLVSSHFYIGGRLLVELLPPIIFSALLAVVYRKRIAESKDRKQRQKIALALLTLGLAGSLPLMLTLVQRKFYMSPSLPFFALAMAMFVLPAIRIISVRLQERRSLERGLQMAVSLILVAGIVITFAFAGKPGRDKVLLHDVYLIGSHLPGFERTSCEGAAYNHWQFQYYLLRYYDVYLDKTFNEHEYYIVRKGFKPRNPDRYMRVEMETEVYDLYLMRDADLPES